MDITQDKMKWEDIVPRLPERQSYNDIEHGKALKLDYLRKYLPELESTKGKKIVDIGAGTGFFCSVCRDLGHDAIAVLSTRAGKLSHSGYRDACTYLGVPVVDLEWGTEPAPFEDNSIDIVNSQGMLGQNRFEMYYTMLDDMLRVTAPGGVIVLSMNIESGIEHMKDIDAWASLAKITEITVWRPAVTWKFKK